jgi:hypothetical protein
MPTRGALTSRFSASVPIFFTVRVLSCRVEGGVLMSGRADATASG